MDWITVGAVSGITAGAVGGVTIGAAGGGACDLVAAAAGVRGMGGKPKCC